MKRWYRCSCVAAEGTDEPHTDVLAAGAASAAAYYLEGRGHEADDEPVVTVQPLHDSGEHDGAAEALTMRARVVWAVARG